MKSKQSWMGRQSKRVLTGIMSLAAIVGTTALAQAPAPQPGAKQEAGIDKSEGVVKTQISLAVIFHRLRVREGGGPKL